MAAAFHDPPVTARDKGDRVILVFGVSNVKHGSVQVEHLANDLGETEHLVVQFSSMSPARCYQRTLKLPGSIVTNRLISDIQNKCVTVQLLKEDPCAVWGASWVRQGKGQRNKTQHKSASDQASAKSKISATPGKQVEEPITTESQTEADTDTVVPAEARAEDSVGPDSSDEPRPQVANDMVAEASGEVEEATVVTTAALTADVAPESLADNDGQELASEGFEEGSLLLPPPSNLEVDKLVQQGLACFASDKKKAIVLLRLAAKKGYLPAYALLAQEAQSIGDEALMIDMFFTLLSEAPQTSLMETGGELLSQCALQLSSVLTNPTQSPEVERRRMSLEILAQTWPVLSVVLDAHTSLPTSAPLDVVGCTEQAAPPPQRPAAGQKTPEQIARLPPKLRERLLHRGILQQADVQSLVVASHSPGEEAGATGQESVEDVSETAAVLLEAQADDSWIDALFKMPGDTTEVDGLD